MEFNGIDEISDIKSNCTLGYSAVFLTEAPEQRKQTTVN